MRIIKAKFSSKCASCGGTIPKGINIQYDEVNRMAFHQECYDKISNAPRAASDPASGMIDAQEDAYFDNFCQQNNI